ncbi:MAG: fused MFS/spermidine synthase [Nitrospirae bacterium]|nr:fused MFS/spermidine synthase [Nitrospirota bacterium]
MNYIVLIAFGFSGAAALIYEVVWTRALSIILGSTTYALSTMLSTFMAGLAIGGFIGGRIADRNKNLLITFGLLELGIGIFGLITIPLIHLMPPLYFKIYKMFHLSPTVYFIFQFILCSAIMLIPTTLMGATFPVVSKKVTSSMDEIGRWVGSAYSFNTFGAIIGSFSAGFILMPIFGVKLAAIIAACLNITVAFTMTLLSKARLKGSIIAGLVLLILTPLFLTLISREEEWPITYYIAQRYKSYSQIKEERKDSVVLMDKDFMEGRVKAWRDKDGFLVLQVGGKIEGSSYIDMVNTLLLAYLPIASHGNPQSFLTIGLGAGITLQAAKQHVKEMHLVEINKGVIEAVERFGHPGLLDNVTISINDARNFLLLTDKKFDIISSEPSYPTESSVGNLFTKEFYKIAASKLNSGGVFCQWLPYYQLTDNDVSMMVKTFGSIFDYVYVWAVKHSLDLLLVGSNEPFKFNADEIIERVHTLNKGKFPLIFVLSKNPLQIKEFLSNNSNIPLNTDDRPLLEFHAAKNLLTGVF